MQIVAGYLSKFAASKLSLVGHCHDSTMQQCDCRLNSQTIASLITEFADYIYLFIIHVIEGLNISNLVDISTFFFHWLSNEF